MYPPGVSGAEELPKNLVADLGLAHPPFNVRDSKIVASKLGSHPIPHGFTAIPVMSYDLGNINDFRPESCASLFKIMDARYFGTDGFKEYEAKVEPIRKPLSIALNLQEEVV